MEVHVCRTREDAARHLRSRDGGRARTVHTSAGETIGDALHGRLGPAAIRGAAVGGVTIGLATAVITTLVAGDLGIGAALGLALGLTGGPFFGSLAGFSHALHFADAVGAKLGPDVHLRDAHLVVRRA